MERQIRIKAGSVIVVAELYNTKTAEAIWQALPFSSKVNTWGDEIYFGIPAKMELEAGQKIINFGELGYWSPGSIFCIFFGPTPEVSVNLSLKAVPFSLKLYISCVCSDSIFQCEASCFS